MIFYFSGTGNSQYAALKIADFLQERTVDMTEALKTGCMSFRINPGEKIGFVFPVYYSSLPSVVSDFIREANIIADDDCYIFGVITCGALAAGADVALRRMLSEISLHTDCVYPLKMPDNYVMLYDPASPENAEAVMQDASSDIIDIAEDIRKGKKGGFNSGIAGKIASSLMSPMYHMLRNTKKFYADEKCVSCSLCEKVCPVSAIKMTDGKPIWVKNKCAHCTACINRCPGQAIQYGKATAKRGRYKNKIL